MPADGSDQSANPAALSIVREVRVGMEMQEAFPGSPDFYRRWHGLPVVLAVRVRK